MDRKTEKELEVAAAIGVLGLAAIGIGWAVLASASHRLHVHGGGLALLTLALRAVSKALLLALLASVVVAVLASAPRALCTWRALRSRAAYAVLAPPGFDPRPEAIEAFGQQLLGARRRVLGWLDRPACSLRVTLASTPSGRVVYAIELPSRFRGALFNACASAYPGVQLVPLGELDEEGAA